MVGHAYMTHMLSACLACLACLPGLPGLPDLPGLPGLLGLPADRFARQATRVGPSDWANVNGGATNKIFLI